MVFNLQFTYDSRWRQIAVMRDSDTDPKEAFIYHNAGIAGSGNSSYIDSVILRDKDANTAWTSASDGTPEERRYLVQNWRADVTTMLNTSGEPVEWYRYTAYGQPTNHPIADMNGDGDVNATDASIWDDLYAGTPNANAVWLNSDINRDDVFPDGSDDTFYYAQYSAAGSGTGSGYSRQSTYGLRKGYAGYEWDDTLEMWHVRHRVLDSKSGKWTKRDPLGYVDGMSDVEYVKSHPNRLTDSFGLCIQQICNPGIAPGDLLICGNKSKTELQCELLRPGQCNTIQDGDAFFSPGNGWYRCEGCEIIGKESCHPEWWGDPLKNLYPDDDGGSENAPGTQRKFIEKDGQVWDWPTTPDGKEAARLAVLTACILTCADQARRDAPMSYALDDFKFGAQFDTCLDQCLQSGSSPAPGGRPFIKSPLLPLFPMGAET